MKLPPFLDVIAGGVTFVLVLAVVIYPILGIECPQLITTGFAAALGWTFRAGVVVQNGVNNRLKGASNGAASPTGATGR